MLPAGSSNPQMRGPPAASAIAAIDTQDIYFYDDDQWIQAKKARILLQKRNHTTR